MNIQIIPTKMDQDSTMGNNNNPNNTNNNNGNTNSLNTSGGNYFTLPPPPILYPPSQPSTPTRRSLDLSYINVDQPSKYPPIFENLQIPTSSFHSPSNATFGGNANQNTNMFPSFGGQFVIHTNSSPQMLLNTQIPIPFMSPSPSSSTTTPTGNSSSNIIPSPQLFSGPNSFNMTNGPSALSQSSSDYISPTSSLSSSTTTMSSSSQQQQQQKQAIPPRRERVKSFSWTVGESGTNARVSELSMTCSKSKSLKNEFTVLYDILKSNGDYISPSPFVPHSFSKFTNPIPSHCPLTKYKTLVIQHPTAPNKQLLSNILSRRGHNVTTLSTDLNLIKQLHSQDPFSLFIFNQSPLFDHPINVDSPSNYPLYTHTSPMQQQQQQQQQQSLPPLPQIPSTGTNIQQSQDLILNGQAIDFCKMLRLIVGPHCVILSIAESNNPVEFASLLDAGVNDYIPQPLTPILLDVRLTCAERMVYDHRALMRAEEVTEGTKRMVSCIEYSQDCIEIWDPNGHIKYLNHSTASSLGYTRWELLGKEFSFLIENLDVIPQMWATITGGKSWSGYVRTKHANGSQIIFESNISPVYDANDKLIYYNCTKRDVTQKRMDEESRSIEQKKTIEKSRLRLSMMSHDIRTPMSGIIGVTDLLSETELKPIQRHYLDILKVSANSLLNIINDLLDISKIEAGKMDFEKREFDFRETVEDSCELMSERAQNKGLELICFVDPEVPQHLVGDSSRLRQIITNLLGNSVKFTDNGEIVITCQVESITDDSVSIRIEVRDTGIGIKKEALPLLFKAFTQAEGSIARQYSGSGLGLAICKELAQLAFEGDIGVESQYGTGSTFWTVLKLSLPQSSGGVRSQNTMTQQSPKSTISEELDDPMISSPLMGPSTSSSTTPTNILSPNGGKLITSTIDPDVTVSSYNNAPNFGGIRILLVECNQNQGMFLTKQFNAWNISVEITYDATTAYNIWSSCKGTPKAFSMVIMDSASIGTNSFVLSQNIVAESSGSVPLLLLLPLKMRSAALENEAKENGIGEIVTKPIRMSNLLGCLNTLLGFQKQKVLISKETLPMDLNDERITSKELKVLIVDDNHPNRVIAMKMLQSIGGINAECASSGMEALEKFEASKFDLILLDIIMPGMDGFQVTKEIREREKRKTSNNGNDKVIIIAVTANAFKEDQEKCLKSGMNDYLSKPMKMKELRSIVLKWKVKLFSHNLQEQSQNTITSPNSLNNNQNNSINSNINNNSNSNSISFQTVNNNQRLEMIHELS